MAVNSANVFEEMKALYRKHMVLRAHFPYTSEEMIGQNVLQTAPLYRKALGMDIVFDFEEPLTVKDIKNRNEIGGFLNENIIIRLCALLEEHKILLPRTEVDRTIEGYEAANLVKKLRNAYAHSLGRPDAQNPDHKALFRKLNAYLNPPDIFKIENAEHFPNDIDTVIIPLFRGCYKYAEGSLKKGQSDSPQAHMIIYDFNITFSFGSIQII